MEPAEARLGEPVKLRQDCLPTKRDIYNHYLHLRRERQETGEWQHNTPVSIIVKYVVSDVKKQWDKTEIPHILEGRRGEKAITNLLNKFHSLNKHKISPDIVKELDCLYDVAACQHEDQSPCDCPVMQQVFMICMLASSST